MPSDDASPATDWSETIAPDETARFDALAAQLRALQRARAAKQAVGRALHYKPHLGLLAEFATLPDLPAWARVGIFASPASFRAYVRYSSGDGTARSDKEPDVRGIAVKVVGAPGRKLIDGLADATTQDFLAILTATTPFRTPDEFVGLIRAAGGSPLLLLPRVLGVFGLRTFGVLGKLRAGLATPVDSLATRPFFSALPIKWGATAVKYSFAPSAASAPDGGAADRSAPDRFARELTTRLARGEVQYDLRIQGYRSDALTPIEDATRGWNEPDAPWITVGRLTIPSQDPQSERGKRIGEFVEKLSFDPWHATEEFRPLGAMMRARKAAYRDSVIERGASAEPDGSESW